MTDTRDAVLDMLSRTERIVRDAGWAVQGVFGDEPASTFSYTVGLTRKGLPELWIGTLAPAQGARILNDLAKLAIERGGLPTDGSVVQAEWSTPFRLRGPVAADVAEAYVASALHPDVEVVVAQVLWPDDQGRFPDASGGYDQGRFPQRLLPLSWGYGMPMSDANSSPDTETETRTTEVEVEKPAKETETTTVTETTEAPADGE